VARCYAINRLAKVLYEEMERLAPGAGDYVEWDALSDWRRDFSMLCIERIFEEQELCAQIVAHDNVISGHPEEAKKFDRHE
jgi:hypothetical protein